MINILQQPPLPSTVLRPHHDLSIRYPLRPIANGPNIGREDRIASWLESTSGSSSINGPQHPHTPPLRSSDVTSMNSMIAPSHGVLYKGTADSHSYYQSVPPRQISPRARVTNEVRQGDNATENEAKDEAQEAQIVTYLQIPSSINNSKGSLSEFAAQITCLFWFESSTTLKAVEDSTTTPAPKTPLIEEAKPSIGFQKWVTTILSTTQVSQNVILLALMFIYRLKTLNPTVKGKPGSEYRLLTVALMLGNKFLDDNTYTNKTWGEVSGIHVSEIHIMEVEFLTNMRYMLYASEQEWDQWHRKLGRFWDYFDRASRTLAETRSPLPLAPIDHGQIALPSPPASQNASPPFGPMYSRTGPSHFVYPFSTAPHLPVAVNNQAHRIPEIDLRPRKRSRDDTSEEPYPKRMSMTPTTSYYRDSTPSLTNSSTPTQFSDIHTPRLPMPNFASSANGQRTSFPGPHSTQLPPPNRAMSTIYNQVPQRPQPAEPLIPNQQMPPLGLRIPPLNEQPQSHMQNIPHMCSRSSSPTTTLTPTSNELLSPANYTFQRQSPYRPVRGISTLLVPPPSASLHNPTHNVGFNNMHYQPLGRPPSERKTGVVPFLSHDGRPSWAPLSNQYQFRT